MKTKKEEEKRREEEKKNKSTINFQLTIQEMAIRLVSHSEMIRQTTEEKMKSRPSIQLKSEIHQEEDQTFSSVETKRNDFNSVLI